MKREMTGSENWSGVLQSDWSKSASRLLRSSIALEGLTLAQLAGRLNELGLAETEASVNNKLHRGTFQATFLMQCLHVLGERELDVGSVVPVNLTGRSSAERSQ